MGSKLLAMIAEGNYSITVFAVVAFAAALVLGLVLTGLMRRLAPRIGLVDQPDGHRKLHGRAIALGGGAAVFLATVMVLAVLLVVPGPHGLRFHWDLSNLVALFQASMVIVLVGLVDDKVRLRGRQKLVGQFLAVAILIADGLVIKSIAMFGMQVDLGPLAVPFTCFWLLGAINSVNLLDGIDGLATTLGIILVTTFAVLALMIGRFEVALVSLVFAGALCGFLRYNFPPASIFLGDAGSMLIGLVVGTLAIHGSLKGPGTVLLAAPLAVWIIPILDSAAAILRRKLTGRSMYTTDRAHLHHRLMERLGSNRRVLASVALCCTAGSIGALVSVALKSDLIAICVGVVVITVLVTTGMFGRAEFMLVWGHLRKMCRSLFAPAPSEEAPGSQLTVRLQGSRPWEVLWSSLTESAEKLGLLHIRFDVNLPLAHEGYNATWDRPVEGDPDRRWHMEIPLVVHEQLLGRLAVTGRANGHTPWETIEQLSEMIEPLQEGLRAFVEPVTAGHAYPPQVVKLDGLKLAAPNPKLQRLRQGVAEASPVQPILRTGSSGPA